MFKGEMQVFDNGVAYKSGEQDYGIRQLLVGTGSCVQGTERIGLQRVEKGCGLSHN